MGVLVGWHTCCMPFVALLRMVRGVLGVCCAMQYRHNSGDSPDIFTIMDETSAVPTLQALVGHANPTLQAVSVR